MVKMYSNLKKIWGILGLSVDKYHWEYISGGGYAYNYNDKYIILCVEKSDLKKYSSIFIYDKEDRWPVKFDVEKYVKKVSKTLHMTYNYNESEGYESGWYELKFK